MASQAGPPPNATIAQVRTDLDRLRGRLFGLVEACGLPERQERALKACIRTTTYDAQADLEAALRNPPA